MNSPIFIDENINIFTGDQALNELAKENDSKYFKDGKGVTEVSQERWLKAQICEKNHWFVRGIKSRNDRNDYHFTQFNKYNDLKNKQFNSAIEIGCGPFTNLRFITEICSIGKCTLLDPMVLEYIKHPYCSYNEQFLFSENFRVIGKIVMKFFPYAYKIYHSIFSKKTRISQLLNIPGEEIPETELYDLVIMINVIEHCYNSGMVFQNILNITKSGSYIVFEDKLYDNDEIKNSLKFSYDAAHPLKVDKNIINCFLTDNFETVYKRIQSNSAVFGGELHSYEDVYYIGKRK